MLRRLEWIHKCGFFQDFRWDSTLPELARINIIYGPNGSGKTSLALALDGLRHPPERNGYEKLSVAYEADGQSHVTNGTDSPFFDRIHVFSEAYVARSLSFAPGDTKMAAVLTVGEKAVDVETRLEELVKEADELREKRLAAVRNRDDAHRTIETTFGDISRQVVDANNRAGARWQSRGNFNAGVVRRAYEGSHESWVEMTEVDLKERINIARSDKAETVREDLLPSGISTDLPERLAKAMAATPLTMVLDTLAEHPEAASWVDEGRHLHRGLQQCIFCGSPLTAERLSLLDQHFSDRVERVQNVLRDAISELLAIESLVDAARSRVPQQGVFYADLRPKYRHAVMAYENEVTALVNWARLVRRRAEKKLSNVLTSVDASVDPAPQVEGADLLALCKVQNKRVEEHSQTVAGAAKAVELHYLKASETKVSALEARLADQNEIVADFDTKIATAENEITALRSVEGDPTPSARVLTTEVGRLLGRQELKFEAVGDQYRVTRDGEPAVNLSVGERTAIALIHFLESVARFDPVMGKPVVVVDDPVSSLDSDMFMGISTYIWAEAVSKEHIAQIVLLTHNFELFRQWDIQIEKLTGRGGANLRYPSRVFEIRPSHVVRNSKIVRVPRLLSWPESPAVRKKMRSTYQHSFIAVAQALNDLRSDPSLESKLDAQLLFPNVIRRMLESFLAFKRPDWVGDFTKAMSSSKELLVAAKFHGDADALRLRLTRYTNANSHSESPSTDSIVSPDEVATAISAVFEFMHCLDPSHFEGLCEVTEFTAADLLRSPADSGDSSNEP